jgi:hypothetical protein
MMVNGATAADRMVTHRHPLDQFAEAVEAACSADHAWLARAKGPSLLSRAEWCLSVGVTRLSNGNATLIEHWNGSLAPSPAASSS